METTQMVYIDKFQFVTAKKYLALKGPIHFKTVHDRMYPLIRYGQKIRVEKLEDAPQKGDLLVAWSEEDKMLYFGIFLRFYLGGQGQSGLVQLYFTKDKKIKHFPKNYLFGRITNIKISPWEKIKVLLSK